jgi:hypothetical protein
LRRNRVCVGAVQYLGRARAEAEIRAAEEAVRVAAARADDERENFHIQAV